MGAQRQARGFCGANCCINRAIRGALPALGDLHEEFMPMPKKNESRGAKSSTPRPRDNAARTYSSPSPR